MSEFLKCEFKRNDDIYNTDCVQFDGTDECIDAIHKFFKDVRIVLISGEFYINMYKSEEDANAVTESLGYSIKNIVHWSGLDKGDWIAKNEYFLNRTGITPYAIVSSVHFRKFFKIV